MDRHFTTCVLHITSPKRHCTELQRTSRIASLGQMAGVAVFSAGKVCTQKPLDIHQEPLVVRVEYKLIKTFFVPKFHFKFSLFTLS